MVQIMSREVYLDLKVDNKRGRRTFWNCKKQHVHTTTIDKNRKQKDFISEMKRKWRLL